MKFRRYQHIVRFNEDEVEGIDLGLCYIFPKIDGTNGSCWLDDGELKCGSRNRTLTINNDNANFYAEMLKNENILKYLQAHPNHRLFGEWLVPHTLRSYRADAWKKFYIFDVAIDKEGDSLEYLPYTLYQPLLEEFDLEYLAPLRIVKNPTIEYLVHCTEESVNNYLIMDGQGAGEGVVIKNYDFYNKYGKQIWAKIVRSEFKERHLKTMGSPETEMSPVEYKIVNKYVTIAFVEKEFEKIKNKNGGWSSKMIPELLNTVYHSLIEEEMWHILKDFKYPIINFKALNAFTTHKIKEIKADLFN